MSKTRTYCDTSLVKNLLTHQNKKPDYWRYWCPLKKKTLNLHTQYSDGSKRKNKLGPLSVFEANQMASNMNRERGIHTESTKGSHHSSWEAHKEAFMEDLRVRRSNDPNKQEEPLRKRESYLEKAILCFSHCSLEDFDYSFAYDWWMGKGIFTEEQYFISYHMQHNYNDMCNPFFKYMIGKGLLPSLAVNPFGPRRSGEATLPYRAPSEKLRGRLRADDALTLIKLANKQGKEWLANAIEFAILTGWRRADIKELTFDHIQGGMIKKVIRKSEGLLGPDNAVYQEIDLRQHRKLLALINRCTATREASVLLKKDEGPAITVIHDIHGRNDKNKTHPGEVSVDLISKHFTELCVDSGLYEGSKKKPTFHECRALNAYLKSANGVDIEEICTDLAQQDSKVTKMYTSNHVTEFTSLGNPITDDMINVAITKQNQ